ncbi:FecR domain-containing protein [Roseibacillus persicicus]|uniref:FecR domain-containing protein n=1 Tax=Roseibacillus persicicus TaxID=454148 RepID=UPI00280C6B8A|nr:FecR domain-containing protein [Roseibacillus persicicus]MDQ8191746.1 FecR domain-containing protein [Roseibacillus persicicus]
MKAELKNEALLQSLFDGDCSPAEVEEAKELLRSDRKWRKLYLDYSRLHHSLCEKYEGAEGKVVQAEFSQQRRFGVRELLGLAAAILVLGVLTALALRPVGDPATLVQYGPESRGVISHVNGSGSEGRLFQGSTLKLTRGAVSLTFPTGVTALVEGPAELRVTGENALHLEKGRAFFQVPEGAEGFICTTESLLVEDLGTEFGVLAGREEEVHVIKGSVRLKPIDGTGGFQDLREGEGLAWRDSALELSVPSRDFASDFAGRVTIFADDFDEPDGTDLHGKRPDIGDGRWEVTLGDATIRDNILDTSGAFRKAAFVAVPPMLNELSHVLLLTIEAETSQAAMHTPGWAGVSLYTGEVERIFVGDPNGPGISWGLHPAGWQAQNACPQLAGETIVTLRYDYRTGLTELFEGDTTTGEALASEWIAPGLVFDRLRIANGSQLDAAIDAGLGSGVVESVPKVDVRSDIAIRSLRLDVLNSGN